MSIQTFLTFRAVISSRAQDTLETGPKTFHSDDVALQTSVLCFLIGWSVLIFARKLQSFRY